MMTLDLDISSKRAKNKFNRIKYVERTIGSTVEFYSYNERVASMLYADSPNWIRNVIQINRHNLKAEGAK